MDISQKLSLSMLAGAAALALTSLPASAQEPKRPNIVVLMTDDTGWGDFGAYLGGSSLGHPTRGGSWTWWS